MKVGILEVLELEEEQAEAETHGAFDPISTTPEERRRRVIEGYAKKLLIRRIKKALEVT